VLIFVKNKTQIKPFITYYSVERHYFCFIVKYTHLPPPVLSRAVTSSTNTIIYTIYIRSIFIYGNIIVIKIHCFVMLSINKVYMTFDRSVTYSLGYCYIGFLLPMSDRTRVHLGILKQTKKV